MVVDAHLPQAHLAVRLLLTMQRIQLGGYLADILQAQRRGAMTPEGDSLYRVHNESGCLLNKLMDTADGNDGCLFVCPARDDTHYLFALFAGKDGASGEAWLAFHLAYDPPIPDIG